MATCRALPARLTAAHPAHPACPSFPSLLFPSLPSLPFPSTSHFSPSSSASSGSLLAWGRRGTCCLGAAASRVAIPAGPGCLRYLTVGALEEGNRALTSLRLRSSSYNKACVSSWTQGALAVRWRQTLKLGAQYAASGCVKGSPGPARWKPSAVPVASVDFICRTHSPQTLLSICAPKGLAS